VKKVLLFFIPILIFIVGLYWFSLSSKPVSDETKLQDFLVIKGSSASQVGNKLKQEGFVKSSLAFKLYVQITGNTKKIQAGEYRLSPGFSLVAIVNELKKGPVGVWTTIPEGLRREEIAYKFAEFLDKEDKTTFIKEFLQASLDQEGYLFPDTYIFLKSVQAKSVVQKMMATFEKKVDSQMREDLQKGGRSLNQAIIAASLIERETKGEEEKPVVAGIIYKRLKADWPLQIDATLQYAVADARCQISDVKCEWWTPLTKEDLGINSPYNSYKLTGFPPTPISSPGLSSIKAAVYPEESDYWFYIHDVKGVIHFARTISEHNDNIRKYLGK